MARAGAGLFVEYADSDLARAWGGGCACGILEEDGEVKGVQVHARVSGAHESTPLLPEAKIVTYNGTSRLRHDCAEVRNMYDNQGGKVCFFCSFGTGPSLKPFCCGSSSRVAQARWLRASRKC